MKIAMGIIAGISLVLLTISLVNRILDIKHRLQR